MTDHGSGIAEEWLTALAESLDVFARLVQDPRVMDAWPTASILDGYTVGGVAGHVLSLINGLQSGPSEAELISYVDWYRLALSSDERHEALIDLGHALAAEGPAELAASLVASSDHLRHCLRRTRPDQLVPLTSIPGSGVRLDEFVRTRFVEITVHADDIATSTGLLGRGHSNSR